ncbi:MAG: hypothetical protein K6B64_06280 [Acholeplasmatales bacterium]|nr:hypothetical protein [Acholeplasmatales bacterium]
MYNDVCFVRAKLKKDYVYDAIKKSGFKICIPYKDFNIFFRLVREIWFKLSLPHPEIWFNRQIIDFNAKTIVFMDPLLSADLIRWVHIKCPKANIKLIYENRADKTFRPDNAPSYVEKWSYDKDDCREYGMKLIHAYYYDIYRLRKNKKNEKIDILYLGRDKGRLNLLLNYQRYFEKNGFSTYFHICADRSFLLFKNRHYKRVMAYTDYLKILNKSKAILNIVPENQKSVTQRELEAVFDRKKCITNNLGILDFELYDSSRFFILGYDDIRNLKKFMNIEFKKIEETKLDEYKYIKVINSVIFGDNNESTWSRLYNNNSM